MQCCLERIYIPSNSGLWDGYGKLTFSSKEILDWGTCGSSDVSVNKVLFASLAIGLSALFGTRKRHVAARSRTDFRIWNPG
jgi:hypothetical protein